MTPNPPKNVRQRGRSLALRQHPREQLRNRNESTMIRRMILTTMIRLLLRNASVDVGRLRSRHIFVAIVVVEMGSKRQGQHQSMITMMPKQQLQVDCIQQPMTGVKSGSKHLVTAMQDIEPMPLTSQNYSKKIRHTLRFCCCWKSSLHISGRHTWGYRYTP